MAGGRRKRRAGGFLGALQGRRGAAVSVVDFADLQRISRLKRKAAVRRYLGKLKIRRRPECKRLHESTAFG